MVDCVIGLLSNRPQGPSDVRHARPEPSHALSLLERLLVHWPKARAPSTQSIVYGRLCVFLESVNTSQDVCLRLIDIVYMTHRHSSRLRIPPTGIFQPHSHGRCLLIYGSTIVAVKSLVESLARLFRDQTISQHYKIRLLEVTSTFLSYLTLDKLSESTQTLLPVLRLAVGLQMASQNFWETRAYLRSLVRLHQTAARGEATLVSDGDYARLCTYVATNTAVWRAAQWWDKCAAELDDMLVELQTLRSRKAITCVLVAVVGHLTTDCYAGHLPSVESQPGNGNTPQSMPEDGCASNDLDIPTSPTNISSDGV